MDERRFSVSAQELKLECLRRKYRGLLSQADVFPSEENWKFIISNRLSGLGAGLYRKYLVANLLDEEQRCDYHILAIDNFPRYLRVIERDEALETVYSDSLTDTDAFISLIYDCELFDAGRIGDLIDGGHPDIAAELLEAYQPEYDGDDIDAMQFLRNKFDKLPSLGSIELRKGLFKTERRYICPEGHENPCDSIYCMEEDCGKDIKGLTKANREAIDRFTERIAVLREMLD
ncbi:MAG: hypothetical protein K2J12_04520 [Muribaculaceae bacterium]|nr:hypothetical protein [Muribaculaceae bacterium]